MGLHGHRARRLGQAVALDERRLPDRSHPRHRERRAEALEPLGQLGRHDVGSRQPQVDAAQVPLLGAGLQQQPVHGGHAHEDGGLPILDQVEDPGRIEAAERGDRHPGEGEPEPGGEAHDVGDGQGHHGRRGGQQVQRAQPRRPDEGPVAEPHALRVAGRTRGVEERGQVVGAGGGRRRRRLPAGRTRRLQLGHVTDDDGRAGIGHHVVDLGRTHLRVRRAPPPRRPGTPPGWPAAAGGRWASPGRPGHRARSVRPASPTTARPGPRPRRGSRSSRPRRPAPDRRRPRPAARPRSPRVRLRSRASRVRPITAPSSPLGIVRTPSGPVARRSSSPAVHRERPGSTQSQTRPAWLTGDVASPRRTEAIDHPQRHRRAPDPGRRRRAGHPRARDDRAALRGLRGGDGRDRPGRAGRGGGQPPPPGRARRHAPRPRRLRRPAAPLGVGPAHPRALPDRPRHRRGQGPGPHPRRRRLPDQALQPGRAGRPRSTPCSAGPTTRPPPAGWSSRTWSWTRTPSRCAGPAGAWS